MLILSDLPEDSISSSQISFNVDITSAIFAGLSVILCFSALVLSLIVARREAKHRFESVVEDCMIPIAIFIQDAFAINSDKEFRDTKYIDEGDNKLVEGIHKLRIFAITNGYRYLEEAMKININIKTKNNDTSQDSDNPKHRIFSYCLLKLESSYIQYRRSHVSGAADKKERNKLDEYSKMFRKYLRLLSKYMFCFRSKKVFKRSKNYYDELKKLMERTLKLCPKEKAKTNQLKKQKQDIRPISQKAL